MNDRPEVLGRWICYSDGTLALELEATADVVFLSASCRCDRYTLRGVPAKRVDLLVQQGLDLDSGTILVEVSRRHGRFDGAIRDRIAIRDGDGIVSYRHEEPVTAAQQARRMGLILGGDAVFPLGVDRHDGPEGPSVRMRIGASGSEWSKDWGALRWCPSTDTQIVRVVQWHATRYYPFLDLADVERVATEAPAFVPAGATLAEINRGVSRLLYEAARQAGWRKLTLREQDRAGLVGQWHRDNEVLVALAAAKGDGFGTVSGCGEATLRAAHCIPGTSPWLLDAE